RHDGRNLADGAGPAGDCGFHRFRLSLAFHRTLACADGYGSGIRTCPRRGPRQSRPRQHGKGCRRLAHGPRPAGECVAGGSGGVVKTPLYFDYAATTPVDPRVVETMLAFLGPDGDFGNPSSMHVLGRKAKAAVEAARDRIGALLEVPSEGIVFTSGATEADNLAIKGV